MKLWHKYVLGREKRWKTLIGEKNSMIALKNETIALLRLQIQMLSGEITPDGALAQYHALIAEDELRIERERTEQ